MMLSSFSFILVTLFAVTFGAEDGTESNLVKPLSNVRFFLYNWKVENFEIDVDNVDSLDDETFDPSLESVLIVHGYDDGYMKKVSQVVKNATLANSNVNVIMMDYEKLSSPYLYLYFKARSIAKVASMLINKSVDSGKINLNTFSIVAHSFGAHIAGFIANGVDGEVQRIVGLDPAGPLFTTASPKDRLSTDDARYVDCFLTSPILGISKPICLVNYFVNGAKDQPACATNPEELLLGQCSHEESAQYYAETIINPEAYAAYKCPSGKAAKEEPKSCDKESDTFMTSLTNDRNPPGSYYVPVKGGEDIGDGEESSEES